MSTATRFKYHRAFTFCPNTTYPGANYNYIESSSADAQALWWNLESLELVSTGTRGAADINWTTTFGPVESLPFISNTSPARFGSYYISSSPAAAPRSRVCIGSLFALQFLDGRNVAGLDVAQIIFEIRIHASAIPGNVRIYYHFSLLSQASGTFDNLLIKNPAAFGPSGVPPSSGSFTILGLTFDWVGGGYDRGIDVWSTETVTFAATSAPYTY